MNACFSCTSRLFRPHCYIPMYIMLDGVCGDCEREFCGVRNPKPGLYLLRCGRSVQHVRLADVALFQIISCLNSQQGADPSMPIVART